MLITRNGGGDLSVYLQLTRGVAKRDHAFPADKKPTVFISAAPLSGVSAELLEQGVAAITLEDIRWKYCHIKAIALLPNILLRQQAIDAGAVEAILHREQQVTEGAASNIFIVNKGRILTPPKGRYLLPGITRDLVLELAMANGIPCQEEQVLFSDLEAAEEIWLTSSTREILPVTRLNGQPVGDGSPGPVWRRMFDLYQVFKHTLRN
jgi:D-alanine transaminase